MSTYRATRQKEETKEANKQRLASLTLYTITEIEPVLGVTHRTILQYIKDGRLKAVKVGGKWKITEANLMKFANGD
jgi:excisionase family DNA binding protein